MNSELKDHLVGGFRLALDEMQTALRDGDTSLKIAFDVAEFSAQLDAVLLGAAHQFTTSIASDLKGALADIRQAGAGITVLPSLPSADSNEGKRQASGTERSNGLARTYNQITAAVRKEYRLMTQMLRLEGEAYQTADQRLQVVQNQVIAYEDMIRQSAQAGQEDERRAAKLQNLREALSARYEIASASAEQTSMERDASELIKLYTQYLEITQRIQLAGDQVSAGLILQRQQIEEAYLAQQQIVQSYQETAAGAKIWEHSLDEIAELTNRYTDNTATLELVREQEKLNDLRLREVQLAYQAQGQYSEELDLITHLAAKHQEKVDQFLASHGENEAYLAAQRSGIAQITQELEKQAEATAKLQDAQTQKSEGALYTFNIGELQAAYKEALSVSTKLWEIQERIKNASSGELPYLRQIEESLQTRLSLSQAVFTRLRDYPEAVRLQGQLTEELNTRQAEYNLKLLQSGKLADSLSHTLEYMAGSLMSDIVRGFAHEIANAFREAVTYVEEYNSLLTEISIVTGRTQEDVEALGGRYRDLAREMNVSSKQIAEAAVGYYRQGLSDAQVMERLTKTVQFSKTANLEFSRAAEYLTATVNSMDISIERAADVFNYLGDATATGADEVAVAYSKIGGAARSANLEFEKVASWIASSPPVRGRPQRSSEHR